MANALKEAVSGFRRAPLLTGLSALMVGLALLVLGLFTLAAYNLKLALSEVEERVEVVAFLREGVRPVDREAAIHTLRALPGVEEVLYISKEQALERALTDLPEIAEVSSDLEVNPFPASLEVRFLPGSRNAESVEAVSMAAQALPAVEDVRYGREWVDRLFSLRRIGGITAITLGAAFALVAALIIGTAIRIAVFARREEISIMQLVGATDGYIRRPFLLEGAMTGLLGGLLAVLLTWGMHQAVYHFLFTLEWIPGKWVLGGLGAGIVFGVVASGLAVRRYLREI
ncbi:MAG: cell division protein FtsX [Longimicrobiales bacterium]